MPTAPNIVFFLIDDHGWRDLGCYGSSFYDTPNIDRLAAAGMRFTDAYASCPVCSPSRASLMSGKYPARVGVTNWIGGENVGRLCDVPYFRGLPVNELSVATALRQGGYQTWHVGKWHLGERRSWPDNHGFDVNVGGCGWGLPHKGYFSPWDLPTLKDGPEGEYLTDRLTNEALQLIKDRDPARPFFLNFWHYAVHTPIQAPKDLIEKYEQRRKDRGIDQMTELIDGEYFPFQAARTKRIRRRIVQGHATYAAMMENLDTNVGRVLDALEAAGVADNTLVVFTSDNGGLATAEGSPTCNLPLAEGKGWMYEGGTRVCQIARWPQRIAAGSTCQVPTTSPDWYPTLLQAAGLPLRPEQHVDGVSLLPLLEKGDAGEEKLGRDALFWHYPHYSNQGGTPACSIRQGDWKLIEFYEDWHVELYNLRDDQEEKHDRAGTETARVEAMRARLTAWRKDVEALIPKPNPNYISPPEEDGVDPAHV